MRKRHGLVSVMNRIRVQVDSLMVYHVYRGPPGPLRREANMITKTFQIQFDDDETLPSRLREFAEFNGVSEDVIIKRAIGKYVGMFGLKERPADSKATNIQDVFIEIGLHKPT